MKKKIVIPLQLTSIKLMIPLALIAPNILLWSGILAVDGIIIQRDYNFPIFNENFEKAYFPLWNDITSQTNIERFPRLVMMSPFIGLSMLGVEVSIISKIMIVGTFTFITITSYLFIKSLLVHLYPAERKLRYVKILSLFGAFIFAYNPANMQFIGGISILVSVGILPLLLYFVLTHGTKKYFPLLIAPTMLLSLGHPFTFVMNSLLTVIFMFVVYRRALSIRRILSKLFMSSMLLTLLMAWLWIPYLSISISSVELGRDQQLARQTFDLVSDNNFYKIFLLERDKFVYTSTEPSDTFGYSFHYLSLALLIGIAFSIFLLYTNRIRRRIVLFLSGGFFVSTLLALGSAGALNELYWLFVSESSVGWIFRSPLKFQLYQGVFISCLFVISLMTMRDRITNLRLSRKLVKLIIPSILVLIFIGSSSYGIYNANTISFNPIQLPQEYFEINDFLKTKADGSRVVYYPRYNEIMTPWSQGHIIGPFDAKSSSIPTYEISTSYSYVKEILYDYPYTHGILGSDEFVNFLSSIGTKYIVFHNDRGYSIDQKNVDYLLNSNKLTFLFGKNNWYLFEIREAPTQQIHAIYDIAETNSISGVLSLGSKSLAVLDRSILPSGSPTAATNLPNDELIKLKLSDIDADIQFENNIQNPEFTRWKDGSLLGWSSINHAFNMAPVFDRSSNESALELSTESSSGKVWSNFVSNETSVNVGEKYLFTLEAKTQNAYGTHAKIQGYDISLNKWEDLIFVTTADAQEGSSDLSIKPNSDWMTYWKTLTIPADVTKIRYIINAGIAADSSLGKGITLIKQVGAFNLDKENSAHDGVAINYLKISPTNYQVHITNSNGNRPFILIFSEAYDKGWVASYDNKEIKSIQMYGMINGFYVDKTGDFALNIEYKPQILFGMGAVITLLTANVIIVYFLGLYWSKIRKNVVDLALTLLRITKKESYQKQVFNKADDILVRKEIDSTNDNIHSSIPYEKKEVILTRDITNPETSSVYGKQTLPKIMNIGHLKKDVIFDLLRNNSSSIAILLGIALTMSIPFAVSLGSSYSNTIAAFALDSLVVGVIWKSVIPQQRVA